MEIVKSKSESVRCTICNEIGKWKNVDQYRYKPSGMCMCESCGFVTYPDVLMKTKDLTEFYREEYRDAPGFANLVTGEKKVHYHAAFLENLFTEWKQEQMTSPVICEIGSAFGMALNFFKKSIPGAKLHGTELTKSMVRNAFWMYGLTLTEEIDTSLKYDLIMSYKVAEHMPEFDKELAKYASLLAPKGRLYISVPTWFGQLSNFGAGGFGIEYYYHKNHINVWTQKHFEGLLARCGFKIVQQNHTYYDQTYLCVYEPLPTDLPAGKPFPTRPEPLKEDPADIEMRMKKILAAATAFDQGDYANAIEMWPNFPEAHSSNFEVSRAKLHQLGVDAILETVGAKAMADCPKSSQMVMMNADICMRYNKWEKAIEFLNKALDWRPEDGGFLLAVANCFRQLAVTQADPREKIRLTMEARNVCSIASGISQAVKQEAINWMMADNARIPTPHEGGPKVAKPKNA